MLIGAHAVVLVRPATWRDATSSSACSTRTTLLATSGIARHVIQRMFNPRHIAGHVHRMLFRSRNEGAACVGPKVVGNIVIGDGAKIGAVSVVLKVGRGVQVDPMTTMLKAPGTMHLKPKYDVPPSNIAFKFNVRRYMKAIPAHATAVGVPAKIVAGSRVPYPYGSMKKPLMTPYSPLLPPYSPSTDPILPLF